MMAKAQELPQLVTEFVDMSKEYLRQETLEPAKQLGRYSGFAIGAAIAFAFGALFLGIAGMRWIVQLLPDGPNWQALGYILAALALGLIAAMIVGVANRGSGGE
jgi:apolipoprotein N-acyltransferase